MKRARLNCLHRRWLTLIIVVLVLHAAHATTVTAQTAEFTQNSKNNNALTVEIPLGNYPGRGFNLPISLRYSSQGLWRVGFINSVYVNVWGVNIRRSVAEAIYAEHSTAGWKTSLDVPTIEWPKLNDRYWANGKPYANGYVSPYTYRVANVYIHMPDGSTHELRKVDQVYQDSNYVDMTGTFYAVDSSRLRYDSSGATTGTLYLADGTRWIFNSNSVQCIDRNGNTLNYNTATRQWTDTIGRVLNMPWPTNPAAGDYNYSVPGINGSSINYTLKFRYLSDTLISGSPALIPMSDYYLPTPYSDPTNQGGSNFPQTTGTATMFASGYSDASEENQSTYTYVVGRGQSGASTFNPVVLSEVVLPNGQSYRFSYDNYGELAKVIYPGGGYQRYSHSQVPMLGGASVPYEQGSRGLTSRWVSPTGTGTDEAQWSYSTTGGMITVTEPDATGAPNGRRYETYLFNVGVSQSNFGYRDSRNGLPYDDRTYAPQAQGGAMLRRTLIDYGQTSGIYNKPHAQYPGTYTAYRNPRPNRSVNLILDTGTSYALASTDTTTYDGTYQFNVGLDALASSEYSFALVDQTTAQTGAITSIPYGSLLRTTQTSYLTGDINYRSRNILGLASSVTIVNAASQVVAQTTFGYDEPSYPLITIGAVTGWTDPQVSYRGNLTTSSRWLDYPTSSWISTHAQYDQCGSARYTWDARGNQSSVSYSSTYAYAFPTQTTSAVPDPTGTHGSTLPLVTSTVYDFNTGLITSSTDANTRTTTFEYSDSMNRPTKVNQPDGGWTMTEYSDVPGNNYVRTQVLQQTTPSQQTIETYQFFDKLGRPSRAFAKEGTTYITTDTQYDNLGRAWRVSNPYRTSALTDPVNPAGTWTTSTFDALSRVTIVTTPDGAQVGTVYSAVTTGTYIGTSITVTDPAGKMRTTVSDAEGRIIQVSEDPNGLSYQTNYTYDVLNNLRRVEQGSQLRYFGYDSLSRIIRVRHVEQTVNSALNWTDPVTGYNGGWTTGFAYDANGNTTSRIDARNITRSTTYDALNRPTIILYRINGQPDPTTGDIEHLYDNAVENGKGRPWITLKAGSQSLQTTVARYDPVGRVKQLNRLFGNGQGGWYPAYEINATYDFAGHLTSQSYPSGHIVTYGYDAAGRLNNFAGNLGSGTQLTYSTAIGYSPFGMEQEKFGTQTQLYRKLHYNVRGQLYDVRVSTSSLTQNEWDWNRGALVFYFGGYSWGQSGAANNGNANAQQHWIPADEAYSTYSYTQDTYGYDSLNRISFTSEVHGGPWGESSADYVQTYSYDRFGNRTINQAQTTVNVPRPAYTVDSNTNRLIAPAGFSYGYDEAGNQNYDSYTGEGSRTFDAENRIKQAWAYNQWQTYTYDGEGERVKRQVNGIETWQVYGIGGELLAEYSANGAPSTPTTEYGYRNGELLITASGSSCGVGYTTPKTWLATNAALGHNTGHAEGTNWAAYVGVDSSQHMLFGPYDSTFGQGHHTVQFTLMVDNNSGADVVGTLDVVNSYGTNVLAQRQIRRSDFAAANQWQTFSLQFDNPCFGQTEARVWWAGNTNAKVSQLTITPLNVATSGVQWLVMDRLGTPRMVLDKMGSLSGISRHDYLPFGEDVFAGVGGRTTNQGYTGDSTRQHFTGYEMDAETGLNFAQVRYQSPVQGRFTSVDPLGASATVVNPQSFNRYSYVTNNPVNMTDPTGMMGMIPDASSSWSDVANGFWGVDFGGPEPSAGRQIIEAAMNSSPDIGGPIIDWRSIEPGMPVADGNDEQKQDQKEAKPHTQTTQEEECDCTLEVRGKPGEKLSKDNPLKFPNTGNHKLGPNISSERYGYQIEETGTVKDDISTWHISRSFRTVASATFASGRTVRLPVDSGTEISNSLHQPKGGTTFYALDAPGLDRVLYESSTAVRGRFVGNFTTRMEKGNKKIEKKWSVVVNVVNGRISGQFRPYHVRLR
jgi:RHS repeat-associated protein